MSRAGFEHANTELRLGLPGDGACEVERKEKKRVFLEINDDQNSSSQKAPQSKNQVTGWPPVCSYRRRNSIDYEKDGVDVSKSYVKTSMDGVPFLRKLDVWKYKGYLELVAALEKLFGIGGALEDVDNSEYVPIYEDNDGDWMLVGDVPWNMFVESCKRLRVMKKSEVKGFGF